ncbi:ABC transporter ATP-binding protein [Paenibacillus sp. GCM10027627]|uniref:ABC transporter ATP-binding protein n=1 Tax=unclassified Paenibacillus TaxID=185978 RepID=UPI00363AFC5B
MIVEAFEVKVGYGDKTILSDISLSFERGQIHSILGPNGCGKSTFLKAIAKQLNIEQGNVVLNHKQLNQWKRKELAREVAFLMQSHAGTPDITVQKLIAYGRFPHKKPLQRLDQQDEEIISWAMDLTNLTYLANRNITSLSGGERQRAWIAMALVQQPNILLLDEPTTYLDIHHQLEIIELVKELNKKHGMTVIMVLHDLNQAASVSDQLAVFSQGKLYSKGTPLEVISIEMLQEVFRIDAHIGVETSSGKPYIGQMKLLNK